MSPANCTLAQFPSERNSCAQIRILRWRVLAPQNRGVPPGGVRKQPRDSKKGGIQKTAKASGDIAPERRSEVALSALVTWLASHGGLEQFAGQRRHRSVRRSYGPLHTVFYVGNIYAECIQTILQMFSEARDT